MAGKFIELKAAAKQLGITIEQLQELREAGKIHGYKDGASWKFKPEEVARLVSELSAASGVDADELGFGDSASFSGDDFDSLLKVDAESDADDNLEDSSILISSDAQPDNDLESSSTVIGQEKADKDLDSDLRLADDDEDSDIEAGRQQCEARQRFRRSEVGGFGGSERRIESGRQPGFRIGRRLDARR